MNKGLPIPYKPKMMCALLEDRKTQTRRIVKPQPEGQWQFETGEGGGYRLGTILSPHPKKGRFGIFTRKEIHPGSDKFSFDLIPSPYGGPGDLLWVREAWALDFQLDDMKPSAVSYLEPVYYFANDKVRVRTCAMIRPGKKRISYHMPRWASRVTLEIIDVRVERLQEISDEDAKAEGCDNIATEAARKMGWYEKPRRAFRRLWEQINGAESWDTNPLVWVVEFKLHRKNIDQLLAERGEEAE